MTNRFINRLVELLFSLHHSENIDCWWIYLTLYHWNALNWLLKLLVVGLIVFDSKLPKPDSDWFPVNWFVACVGFNAWEPKLLLTLLLKLLFARFVLICAADVGDVIVVGWIGNAADWVFTGLCDFSWFIDNDGPIDFDFVESKLSKSIFMGPAFDQVWPTIFNVVGFVWLLISVVLVDIGCNKVVFVGCSMSAKW